MYFLTTVQVILMSRHRNAWRDKRSLWRSKPGHHKAFLSFPPKGSPDHHLISHWPVAKGPEQVWGNTLRTSETKKLRLQTEWLPVTTQLTCVRLWFSTCWPCYPCGDLREREGLASRQERADNKSQAGIWSGPRESDPPGCWGSRKGPVSQFIHL